MSRGSCRITTRACSHLAIDLREHPAVLGCNDAQAIRDAALAGVGISLQGGHMASDPVADGWMIELLPDWRLPVFDVHLLWLPGVDRDPALRRLVNFLAEALPSHESGLAYG